MAVGVTVEVLVAPLDQEAEGDVVPVEVGELVPVPVEERVPVTVLERVATDVFVPVVLGVVVDTAVTEGVVDGASVPVAEPEPLEDADDELESDGDAVVVVDAV